MTISERLNAALAERYRIERELGQGGMATVYLAEDLKHGRKVAIKVLKPELAAVLGADRFVQEIKTTAQLQHPHILPLHDSGTADGFLYYVMPYIEGETLRDKLDRETQLGIDEAVRIAREVADALDYAHRNGIIHRDIKPENILLHDGRPMVADFGIALAVSAAAGGRMTETGTSVGTPHYMSPEQATADKEITGRADQYALASVLYEMLTGSPPHVGSSAQQVIMKIIAEPVQPVAAQRKSVPPNVAAAVMEALEKLPADRFTSAKEFAEALANPNFAAPSLPAGAGVSRGPTWKAALAGGLILGGIAGAAGSYLLSRDAGRVGEVSREQLTFNGRSWSPAIAPEGDFVAFVETECEHGGVSRCRSSLMLQEVGSTQSTVLIRDARALGVPRWSHDGQTIVIGGDLADQRHGLFAVSRSSAIIQSLSVDEILAYDTHPAADSVLVVVEQPSGSLLGQIVELHTGTVRDTVNLPFDDETVSVSWSPDGSRIAAISGSIVQISDRRGELTGSLVARARDHVRWSVDGDGVIFALVGAVREDSFVRARVGREGAFTGAIDTIVRRIPTLYEGMFDIARRSGRMVIGTGDAATDIASFDIGPSGIVAKVEARGTTWYGDPALSLDGHSLFYYQGDAAGDNVYMLDRASGAEEGLTAVRSPGGNRVRLSADGRRLLYERVAGTSDATEYLVFPSRRVLGLTTALPRTSIPVGTDEFLVPGRGEILWVDSTNATRTRVDFPDSLEYVAASASLTGDSVLVLSWLNVRTQPQSWALVLAGRQPAMVRVVNRLPPGEPAPSVTWLGDGTVYLGRWLETDPAPSLWRTVPGGGPILRVADLPEPCRPDTITVAAGGTVAACSVDDFRWDVWLFDVAGVTR